MQVRSQYEIEQTYRSKICEQSTYGLFYDFDRLIKWDEDQKDIEQEIRDFYDTFSPVRS